MLRSPTSRWLTPIFSATRALHLTPTTLSGHSKWSTIKHDKAKNDAARQAVANRLATQITVCVRAHGSEGNPQLSALLEKARSANVPKKLVEAAVARGNGQGPSSDLPSESTMYEAIGAGGVSFVVEAFTNNKARCVAHVRHAFTRFNGSFGPTLYMFDKRGYVNFRLGEKTFDEVFEDALEVGAEEVEELPLDTESTERDAAGLLMAPVPVAEVVVPYSEVNLVADALKAKGYHVTDAGTAYFPKEDMAVSEVSEDHQEINQKIMAALGEIEDVTEVHTSFTG